MFLLHDSRQILLKYRFHCIISLPNNPQYLPSTHRTNVIYHPKFALFPLPDTFSPLSPIFPQSIWTWSHVPQTCLASPCFSIFPVPSQHSRVVKDNLWSQMAWVCIPSLPLANCVPVGKLFGKIALIKWLNISMASLSMYSFVYFFFSSIW